MLKFSKLSISLLLLAGACSSIEERGADSASGRFLNVWGVSNVAELTSRRVYVQNGVVTEIVVPRRAGELTKNGADVLVVGLRMRVQCSPVSYSFDRQTYYGASGATLAAENIDGSRFASEGPYSEVARELCSRESGDVIDFRSLAEFHQLASTRQGGVVVGRRPTAMSDK